MKAATGAASSLENKEIARPSQRLQDDKLPILTFGPRIDDPKEIAQRLQTRWQGKKVVDSLKQKLKDYEKHFGALDDTKKNVMDRELQILMKVVEEGEEAMQMKPSEQVALDVIKNGMREYIDFAMDELGRHDRLAGVVVTDHTGFDWRTQGSPDDNPCLRCSSAMYSVSNAVLRTTSSTTMGRASQTATTMDNWWATLSPTKAKDTKPNFTASLMSATRTMQTQATTTQFNRFSVV